MKIAIVAAEITPWAKAGGLADVIGALPAALKQCGAEPSVILPGYRGLLDALKTTPLAENLSVPIGGSAERFATSGLTCCTPMTGTPQWRRSWRAPTRPCAKRWAPR